MEPNRRTPARRTRTSNAFHTVRWCRGAPIGSVKRFAAVVYALGSIGWVIEALVTAWILGYIARVRPGLVWHGAVVERGKHLIGHEAGRV